jgi:hypothetical protein
MDRATSDGMSRSGTLFDRAMGCPRRVTASAKRCSDAAEKLHNDAVSGCKIGSARRVIRLSARNGTAIGPREVLYQGTPINTVVVAV